MDPREIQTTLELAMLDPTPELRARLADELQRMVDYAAILAEVADDEVAPMPIGQQTVTRPDTPHTSVDPDTLLENAPELEDRFFAVPNIL